MPSPRQIFEESIRPAELLVRVYRLLECERIETGGALMDKLRPLIGAARDEDLLLVVNDVFLGLIRESAQMPTSVLKRTTLDNLLRQAVVAACTGLDTYLPSLLRANLPLVIQARGRDFFPQDAELQLYFKDLTFDLTETVALLSRDDAPDYLAGRIRSHIKGAYLSSKKGVHIVGALLQLDKPWDRIAAHLGRDRKELMSVLEDTTVRRNDIVLRADRPQSDPEGPMREISYAWTSQAVETIRVVCLALDELVRARMAELQTGLDEHEAEA
jgi:hypothetical protein